MYRGDLSRMLKAFEPDLADALHLRLWSHLGKDGEYDSRGIGMAIYKKMRSPDLGPITISGFYNIFVIKIL